MYQKTFFDPINPQKQFSQKRGGTLFFDGASKNNPGISAGGVILLLDGEKKGFSKFFGDNFTNNEAEYLSLIFGIEKAIEFDISDLIIMGDSKLVVEQIKGNFSCNFPHLEKLKKEALILLMDNFDSWEIIWIPRKHNEEADRLSQSLL